MNEEMMNEEVENETPSLKSARQRGPTHKMHSMDTWDNYDKNELKDRPWVRATSLAAPPARPGMRQRWIRVAIRGVDDPSNAMRKFREGWKPRSPATLPSSFQLPTISHGQWAGCIGIEGSILCEIPEEIARQRDKYFKNKTDAINDAIEAELQKESSSKMPITQVRKSTTGIVRRPRVKDDE